jgi:acetoin utilization deacetylase AcuC-like enzyme
MVLPSRKRIAHFMVHFDEREDVETKRRFHNLLQVSKVYHHLTHLKEFEAAPREIIEMNHSKEYVDSIIAQSSRTEGGYADDITTFSQYGYDIAALAVGGVLHAGEQVVEGKVDCAYVLCRPPGHHAIPSAGMGFCIFNNIAIAARYLRSKYPDKIRKVAIVDYDVHHGNGTQDSFYSDENVLFISIHQDRNFPLNTGFLEEDGEGKAKGTTINIPLPPGSGSGAYKCAFDSVVIPGLNRFKPDIILVSSGFDASYMDPLSAMILSSEDFGEMAKALLNSAERLCDNRILFSHEGGYSDLYVPFCGVRVVEEMLGVKEVIADPLLSDAKGWGGQELMLHQFEVIDNVCKRHGLERPLWK